MQYVLSFVLVAKDIASSVSVKYPEFLDVIKVRDV